MMLYPNQTPASKDPLDYTEEEYMLNQIQYKKALREELERLEIEKEMTSTSCREISPSRWTWCFDREGFVDQYGNFLSFEQIIMTRQKDLERMFNGLEVVGNIYTKEQQMTKDILSNSPPVVYDNGYVTEKNKEEKTKKEFEPKYSTFKSKLTKK